MKNFTIKVFGLTITITKSEKSHKPSAVGVIDRPSKLKEKASGITDVTDIENRLYQAMQNVTLTITVYDDEVEFPFTVFDKPVLFNTINTALNEGTDYLIGTWNGNIPEYFYKNVAEDLVGDIYNKNEDLIDEIAQEIYNEECNEKDYYEWCMNH